LSTKPVHFMGSSQDDLRAMPEEVRSEAGYAIYLAQEGEKHGNTKPLKGFGGASVLEAVIDDDGDTYRAVYTVQFKHAIYVLHCFRKKAKKGIATPKLDLDRIGRRLAAATEHYLENYEKPKKRVKK
jgi:phage-related protein